MIGCEMHHLIDPTTVIESNKIKGTANSDAEIGTCGRSTESNQRMTVKSHYGIRFCGKGAESLDKQKPLQ